MKRYSPRITACTILYVSVVLGTVGFVEMITHGMFIISRSLSAEPVGSGHS